ncbi:Copia protein, partial [Camponotus floridanus]
INQVEKLNGVENFQLWKFEITILLKANDLYEVATEVSAVQDAAWLKKDANAQKVIVLSLGKKPMTHVLNCKTAQSMWAKLCAIYERDSEQRKCALMQEFFSYTMDKSCDVTTHISKLVNIASNLKALNADIADPMLISKILVTLPDSFKGFVTAWES